jgi:hypothetical protein
MRALYRASVSPAAVSRMRRATRSNSAAPHASSSSRICRLTAGGVTARRSAARAKLPARTTASNTRSWFSPSAMSPQR